jgi:hypothetical protein
MRDKEPILSFNGYERVSQRNTRRETENVVGGVAIYQNLQSATTCLLVSIHIRCTNDTIGDVCLFKLTAYSRMKFVLGTVYNYPDTSQRDTLLFLSQYLVPYLQSDIETPILLCGDFSFDSIQHKALLKYMKVNFNPDCATESSTTLGNTCLDFEFARNV